MNYLITTLNGWQWIGLRAQADDGSYDGFFAIEPYACRRPGGKFLMSELANEVLLPINAISHITFMPSGWWTWPRKDLGVFANQFAIYPEPES